jgi:hypothetical protein
LESEQGVRLAQQMQVGPCIRVGIQLEKAEVGPTSGPTWRLSHLGIADERVPDRQHVRADLMRAAADRRHFHERVRLRLLPIALLAFSLRAALEDSEAAVLCRSWPALVVHDHSVVAAIVDHLQSSLCTAHTQHCASTQPLREETPAVSYRCGRRLV